MPDLPVQAALNLMIIGFDRKETACYTVQFGSRDVEHCHWASAPLGEIPYGAMRGRLLWGMTTLSAANGK